MSCYAQYALARWKDKLKKVGHSLIEENEKEIVCALVLLNARGDALLQLRDDKPGLTAAGLWVFPGGHTELHEDIFECVEREFFEETEYRCDSVRWLMSINDYFLRQSATRLHVFWDRYQVGRTYVCREGQALEFVERERAAEIAMPRYLVAIWDLARLAAAIDGAPC